MNSKYLSSDTKYAIEHLKQIQNKDILKIELEKLFIQPFTMQALWKFKPFFDLLDDDDVKDNTVLIGAKCFYVVNSGDLKLARKYYHFHKKDEFKAFQNLLLPDTSFELYKQSVEMIVKNDLGIITNMTLTAGRPSVINGRFDFTPNILEIDKHSEEAKEVLRYFYGDYAVRALDLGRAEYLYQINECYEALVLIIANIQFLNQPEHSRLLFVALYLEINIMLMNGQVSSATPLIQRIYDRMHKDGLEELIPNVKALEAWAALYDNDLEKVDEWLNTEAPDEYNFCMLHLFKYMIKMRAYLVKGKYLSITLLAMKLDPLLKEGNRYKDYSELHLLWCMSDYLRGDKKEAFKHLSIVLENSRKYRYDRLIADEANMIYKILLDYEKENGKEEYLGYIIELTRETAKHFPNYLKKSTSVEHNLSQSELNVLRLVAMDKSNQEIADELNVTLNTIKFHNKNIFKKLNVKNRRQAITTAYERGIIN